MGFFKKIFGDGSKDEAGGPSGVTGEASGAAASSWPEQLKAAKRREKDRFSFWEWENETAREAVKQYLGRIAASFGNAKVKENPDDENIELRGVYDGAPVRFAVWMSFGTFWSVQMRCPDQLLELEIERDHEKIPKEKDADDPWDEDEERRIFLGKGIFVEGGDDDIEQKLGNWSRLPEDLRASIIAEMERLEMRTVRAYGQEVSLNVSPGFDDLTDPLAYMLACAQLMAAIKSGAGTGAPADAPGQPVVFVAAGSSHRLTCAYCSSVFILAAGKNTCPNCGAPAQQ